MGSLGFRGLGVQGLGTTGEEFRAYSASIRLL